jgi:2,3-bisphosphoglycerate-dependent phosphoglycerate mutase
MSNFIASVFLCCIFLSCNQSEVVKENRFVFLVRHAEKVDESTDAALSLEGIERSNRLKEILSESEIEHVFSTNFQRTRNTVKPLAEYRQLEIELYSVDTLWEFSQYILKHGYGNMLISGHSNSIPELANLLIGHEKHDEFKHEEYGNILIISIIGNEATRSFPIKY